VRDSSSVESQESRVEGVSLGLSTFNMRLLTSGLLPVPACGRA
jgi:hypothetical protein